MLNILTSQNSNFNFTNFSRVRTWQQAIIFYVLWLVICAICVGVAGIVIDLFGGLFISEADTLMNYAKLMGQILAVILCLSLTVFLLRAKNCGGNYALLFTIGTVVITGIFGGLFGLLIPTYLSTRPKIAIQTLDVSPDKP